MFIKSITIKNFNNVYGTKTIDFAKKFNYLYGKNGAGKSTVLYAIQIAFLGYSPSFGKTKETTFEHCNNDKDMLIRMVLTDGSTDYTIIRSFERNKKGQIVADFSVEPKLDLESLLGLLELPILKYDEFCGLTANKLKDWFTEYLPKSEMQIDWKREILMAIPECSEEWLEEVYTELQNLTHKAQNTLDLVRLACEYSKEYVSVENAQIKRLSSTMQSLVHFDDLTDCSEEAINDIKNEIDTLNTELNNYSEFVKNIHRKEQLCEKYPDVKDPDSISDLIRDLERQIEDLSDRVDNLQEEHDSFETVHDSVLSEYNFIVKMFDSDAICPIMRTTCPSFNKKELSAKGKELEIQLNSSNTRMETLKTAMFKLNNDIKALEQRIYNLKLAQNDYMNLNFYSDADIQKWQEFNLDEVVAEKSRLEKQLEQMYGNAKYEELYNKIDDGIMLANKRLEWFKKLVKLTDVNGLQTTLSEKPFIDMECKLNSNIEMFFGNEYKAKIIVSDKSNGFDLGLIHNSIYVSFNSLSSGEKCLYTLALLTTLIQDSSGFKTVIADDILDHLDTTKADIAFNALSKVGVQYILAGVKPCSVEEGIIRI